MLGIIRCTANLRVALPTELHDMAGRRETRPRIPPSEAARTSQDHARSKLLCVVLDDRTARHQNALGVFCRAVRAR